MIKANIGIETLDNLGYALIAHAVEMFKIPEDCTIHLQGGDTSTGADAECRTDENGNFLVLLNADLGWTEKHFCEVVGHELVHVKQYVHDGLDMGHSSTVKFRGQYYRNHFEVEYWLSPWEIEARGYEAYFWWYANKKGLIVSHD